MRLDWPATVRRQASVNLVERGTASVEVRSRQDPCEHPSPSPLPHPLVPSPPPEQLCVSTIGLFFFVFFFNSVFILTYVSQIFQKTKQTISSKLTDKIYILKSMYIQRSKQKQETIVRIFGRQKIYHDSNYLFIAINKYI